MMHGHLSEVTLLYLGTEITPTPFQVDWRRARVAIHEVGLPQRIGTLSPPRTKAQSTLDPFFAAFYSTLLSSLTSFARRIA